MHSSAFTFLLQTKTPTKTQKGYLPRPVDCYSVSQKTTTCKLGIADKRAVLMEAFICWCQTKEAHARGSNRVEKN